LYDFFLIYIELLMQIVRMIVDIPIISTYIMKKLLLTFTILFMLVCVPTKAAVVIVDYQGPTFVQQRTMERSLFVNCEGAGRHNIAVKPLDDALRSVDGSVSIPLDKVFLNNNREDVYLRYNDYSELFTNLEMDGIPHQFTAKVRDFGMIPAGVYSLNFEIQATDVTSGNYIATSSFNLQFIVPNKQEISLHGQAPQITITATDALNKTKKVANETSPMLYINSNCDWILYLSAKDFDTTKGKFYVRTVSSSPDIKERLQERVLIEPDKEIIIARGKAPCDNQYVAVEYSIESLDQKGFIRAGNFQNRVRYIIREDRR